jgi:hypothetical protein
MEAGALLERDYVTNITESTRIASVNVLGDLNALHAQLS